MDLSRHLLPLGDSSAGATRSVPSPCRYPSAWGSHDTPTIPASDGGHASHASNGGHASDGGGLHTSYRSKSPTGRGRTTPSTVPTMKKGHHCCGCPRHRPGYGGCRRLLRSERQSGI